MTTYTTGGLRNLEWVGSITATSSIAHASKDAGTNHPFRREPLITPTGKRIGGIPVVSGGVIRGDMRRIAAEMIQHAIAGEGGRLPPHQVHAFRTGGSLRESRSGEEVLTSERQAIVRDCLPMLAIFGFSTKGRIVSGRLCVDKAIPITQETLFLAEHYTPNLNGYVPPTVWDTIQLETYTRFADINDSPAQPWIEKSTDEERAIPKGSAQMKWHQETLCPGTRLFHSISLPGATPVEASFMLELVSRWNRVGRIGAQRARGMGRFKADYALSITDIIGAPVSDAAGDFPDWREHLAANADQVKEALSWL